MPQAGPADAAARGNDDGGLTAVVLAGTRAGGDPLAAHAGVGHKALIEIGGRAMVERVVAALAAVPRVRRIAVVIESPDVLRGLPGLEPAVLGGPLLHVNAASGPSASLGAALTELGTPLLVTTADHALLRPAWIEEFLGACPAGADIVAALARRDAVEAAQAGQPPSRRTWLRFADGDFSGCNLFLLAGPRAAGAVAFWRTLEADRKRPLRMVRRLGFGFALRYAFGRLTLADAAARLGVLSGGATVALVTLRDGRAAIDVDKVDDLDLVRRLVAAEES